MSVQGRRQQDGSIGGGRWVCGRKTRLLLALLLGHGAAFAAQTEGKVQLDGPAWKLADGMAFVDNGVIKLVLSSVELDRAAIYRDKALDASDFGRGAGNRLTLSFTDSGMSECVALLQRIDGAAKAASSCNQDYVGAAMVSEQSATRVAGALTWTDGTQHLQLKFDLPVETTTDGALRMQTLGRDGGLPGAVLRAHFAALKARDWSALKAVTHSDIRTMMEEDEADGHHLTMLDGMRADAPAEIEIVEGWIEDEVAHVRYRGRGADAQLGGLAELVMERGKWRMTSAGLGR